MPLISDKYNEISRGILTMKEKIFYDENEQLKVNSLYVYFEQFMTRKEVDSISPATIRAYKEAIKRFFEFAYDDEEVNQELIDRYKKYLLVKYESKSSINNRLTHLKAFLKYLFERKLLPEIKIKKVPCSDMKEAYTVEEIKKLLIKPKKATFEEFRAWVLINFLVGCPLRLTALHNIKWQNINMDIDKTKQDKSYYLPSTLVSVLREYRSKMRFDDEDYVFTDFEKNQLQYYTLGKSLRSYNKKRGVKKSSIHLFRHFVAREAVLAGSPELLLMKMLGHSTLKMSSHYANIFGKINPEHVKYNPLEILTQKKKKRRKKF